DFANTFLL
nr:Chain C, HEV-1-P8L [Henipavirus hendraense]